MIRFEYPWVLYLLWLVPAAGALWYYTWRRAHRALESFVAPDMARKLSPPSRGAVTHWQWACLLAALTGSILAAARPQWGQREETVYQRGRDLLIALDVSRSMLATDVHPSRLGRAKVDIIDLVKELEGDRAGLITFRGKAVLLCPLTTDYSFLLQVLGEAGLPSAPMGETDIGDAIDKAIQAFGEGNASHKAVVLISDGEDLAGRALAAAEKAHQKGITIFTVGLGSPEGASIPSPDQKGKPLEYKGAPVVTRLVHETLRAIAEKTGGAYVPVGVSNVRLGTLYRDHLARIAARDISEAVRQRYIERYQLFLFPSVLLLLVVLLLSRGQPGGRRAAAAPRPALKRLALVLAASGLGLCGAPHPARAAPPAATNTPAAEPARSSRDLARKAQVLYAAGRHAAAAEDYAAAAQLATAGARAALLYNEGCAAYAADEYTNAAAAFRAAEDAGEAVPHATAYNLGTALLHAGSDLSTAATNTDQAEQSVEWLQQASAAFQRDARAAPDHAAGLRNLNVAAKLFPEAQARAKIMRLLDEYGQTAPAGLADQILQEQRHIGREIPSAFTNDLPGRVAALDRLSAEQEKAADMLIPLQMRMSAATGQPAQGQNPQAARQMQQQAQALNREIGAVGDRMRQTADDLADLAPDAYRQALQNEQGIYPLWKGLAEYPMLLREDQYRQTNAVALTTPNVEQPTDELRSAVRREQGEALDLTHRFAQRFASAVPESGLPMPPSQESETNAPSTNAVKMLLTPEQRKAILDLAAQVATLQSNAVQEASAPTLAPSLAAQKEADSALTQIAKLLPKPPSPPPQPQQKKEQKPQQKPQPQPQQEPQQKPQKQEQPKPEPKPSKEDMAKEEAKRVLEKATQREKEHQDELRERETYVPLSPVERDW